MVKGQKVEGKHGIYLQSPGRYAGYINLGSPGDTKTFHLGTKDSVEAAGLVRDAAAKWREERFGLTSELNEPGADVEAGLPARVQRRFDLGPDLGDLPLQHAIAAAQGADEDPGEE